MAAAIRFSATDTDKYLKVTDLVSTKAVWEWLQTIAADPKEIIVSTFDETNGEVKVEIKAGEAYILYADHMPVSHGEKYEISDKPPSAKRERGATRGS